MKLFDSARPGGVRLTLYISFRPWILSICFVPNSVPAMATCKVLFESGKKRKQLKGGWTGKGASLTRSLLGFYCMLSLKFLS